MTTHENNSDCPFCNLGVSRIIEECDSALAFRDGFPVTDLHTLIIPKRHAATYFDLTSEELAATHALLESQRARIVSEDRSVVGFNIGWNCGRAAGQTVFHAHVHLIPRRLGDMENPRGGVRGVIPDKRLY